MSDLPRVTLRVVGSTEATRSLMRSTRVYAVLDGEVIGEVHMKSVEVRLEAGEVPTVLFETFIGSNYVQIDLSPGIEVTA